ncbi:E3 ubiquitin-protein ligase DZIP3-like isoform X2 [Rhinoraja longicauda]
MAARGGETCARAQRGRENCPGVVNDDDAAVSQGELSPEMKPEDTESFCFELEVENVEEKMTGCLDINKALRAFPSMSTDEKIKQFQIFLTAILKNDLICQISQVQYLLLLHYFVTALCSRSKEQDLAEAIKQIRTIEKMAKEKPECQSFLYVAYHTLGCLCYKQNRFDDAIQWFKKSKQEFEENPPTIEWTDVILTAEEIKPENFEVETNKYVEKCTDHPCPTATCQYLNCLGYYKREIYPSDPDYKGYVKLFCDNNCIIQYHTTCWKEFKDSDYGGQPDKNFCSTNCISSGCKGTIVKFIIHDSASGMYTEFEERVPDVSPQLSTVESEPKEIDVLGESSKCQELKTVEMAKKEFHPFHPPVKCRLFQEITQNRKLIENAISHMGNWSELLIEYNIKEEFAKRIPAEVIVDHVLEWNCNFKMRHFLNLLMKRNVSHHSELLEWLTHILELSDLCSLYFLFNYKTTVIQILHESGNLIVIMAKELLSRRAVSPEEFKVLLTIPPDERPEKLMEQMIGKRVLSQVGELVFLLAEEQDVIPKLKPLFAEFDQAFDKFNKNSVPNFGNASPMDSFCKDMDYSLFYRLLHLLIIKGTEVLLQIFDRAVPPQALKRELLKHKRLLEAYHKVGTKAMVEAGEWRLLYPPNNEQPSSHTFDITLLASLMRHLKVLPAPRRGWDNEPSSSDHSRGASLLHLCRLRNRLFFETLNTGITESEFAVMWDRIAEILMDLGADEEELQDLKSFPIEALWEDHHRLAGYLGKPVADVMQLLLSLVQQGKTTQSTEATTPPTSTVLPALPPPSEIKEKVNSSGSPVDDDHSMMLKTKTKSKKKKKKSKSKKAAVKEDDHHTTPAAGSTEHEALSIPVKEGRAIVDPASDQVASSSRHVSTSGVAPIDSSLSPVPTATHHTAPSVTSEGVNQTYQSDGELDGVDGVPTHSNKPSADVYSFPQEAIAKSQGDVWQNSKGDSEIKQKLNDLETENNVLKKNLEHLMIQHKKEQQQRMFTESLNTQLQEYHQLEMSRLKQQLQRKEEEIKKITAQFASERSLWNKDKAKLEDVSAKNIVKLVEATKRAVAAEVLFQECLRDNGLFQLQQAERDCTGQLRAAEANMARSPDSASACAKADGWQAIVADIRNKIDFTKSQFDEQIGWLKSGTKLNMLPQVKIPPPPPHPDAVMKHFLDQHLQAKANYFRAGSGQTDSGNGRPTIVGGQPEASATGREQIEATIPVSTPAAPWHAGRAAQDMAAAGGIRAKNSFERIMEKLSTSYPHFSRNSLTEYLKEVRQSNGGSLSGLTYDDIIHRVASLVESRLSESKNRGQNKSPQPSAWRTSTQGVKLWEGATALSEDPCVICHEDLTTEAMLILPCAHKFHSQCIGPWLKEQRTCPTCRLHVVLRQEFPDLPSRKIAPL